MRKFFVFSVFILLFLVSCSPKPEPKPITSLCFTPLNFPHSDFGEFTLHEATNDEQLQLFLNVFENTFSLGITDDSVTLQDFPNTYSLQLFSNNTLVSIYRLSFNFDEDIAFLQNDQHIYSIDKADFHQIIETGYFNVIFRKNHAPTAKFFLNSNDLIYSVKGVWNYETYQNNFLSYQINKEQLQNTNYIVTDNNFKLTYHFPDKQPNEVYETIRSSDLTIVNRNLLSTEQISIPSAEGNYTYEIEAVWSDPILPYKATLHYEFRLEVNYPPKIKLNTFANAGGIIPISVENYDLSGKVTVSSDLWEKDIPLTLINQKYNGILPIPADTPTDQYPITVNGANSTEPLAFQETLKIKKLSDNVLNIPKKQLDSYVFEPQRDLSFRNLLGQNITLSEEKLWSGNFYYPTAATGMVKYGQKVKHRDFEYQYLRIPYRNDKNYDIYATANGIVLAIDFVPNQGYNLIIDHGLGVLSLYGGMSEVFVAPGSYVLSRQKIGTSDRTDILPNPVFTYGILVHDYSVNPTTFFEQDPISLFK